MKQAVVTEAGKIIYREIPRPVPGPNQALIRVARIGICGSDVHVYEGKHPLVKFPLIQGHEFSGYVEEIGNQVKGFNVKDLVTVEPAISCGTCSKCKVGLVAQCEKMLFIGGALPGAGSEFLAVDAGYVLKMPPGVDVNDAAMTEPLAVAVHAVGRAGNVVGKRLLIMGGGTIGNLTAQVARFFGAGLVVLVDPIPERNKLAEKLGFRTVDPAQSSSIEEAVTMIMGNSRPEVAFECVGKESPLNICISSLERGGTVVDLGVYSQDPQTRMILVQDKEINLLGSLMYSWNDYRFAVELMKNKKVDLKSLQTHHFPFEAWSEAYKLLKTKPDEAVKVLIDLM
jgi:L-iditol 2-dehydrogenase